MIYLNINKACVHWVYYENPVNTDTRVDTFAYLFHGALQRPNMHAVLRLAGGW